jgi:hypothetical protein
MAAQPKTFQPLTAEAVRAQIGGAELKLESLTKQWAVAGYEAVSGDLDAVERADDLKRQRLATEDTLRDLALILDEATKHDRLVVLAANAANVEGLIGACNQHLAARDKAAQQLVEGITQAVAAYKILIAKAEKIRASSTSICPDGLQRFAGTMTHIGAVRDAVTAEIFRLGGDGSLQPVMSFPGGKAPNTGYLNRPAEVTPLLDRLADERAYYKSSFAEVKEKIKATADRIAGEQASEQASEQAT